MRVEKKRKRSAPKYWIQIKGRLYARLQYKNEKGEYQVKYRPISDKRVARSVVETMRRELDVHGEELFKSEKITFEQLLDTYEKAELTEATFQSGVKVKGRRSISAVKSAMKPLRAYFGKKRIRLIKTSDIKNYKDRRLSTPVEIEVNEKTKVLDEKTGKEKTVVKKVILSRPRKIASVNRELELLRAILNYAVQNECLIKNPFMLAKGMISKAAEVQRERVLSFDEEQRLLAVCVGRKAHLRPLLICALDSAMRRGEIFKMRWQEIDFAKREIYIPQTNTKTEVARAVGITARLRDELKKLWEDSSKDVAEPVFGIISTVKNSFKSACKEASIEGFRFHDCRHTATTRMIASGTPHTEVMKITGHSQLKTFLRYLNITSETTNKVASNLDGYLAKNRPIDDSISEAIN